MGSASNLRPWKPGQSGNPGGKLSLPPELRAIRGYTREECSRIVARYGRMECEALTELTRDGAPKLPALDAAIIRIFQEAITKGDFMRLSFLLDRAIGKVQAVEEKDDVDSQLASMNDDELIKHVEEIIRKRKGEVA